MTGWVNVRGGRVDTSIRPSTLGGGTDAFGRLRVSQSKTIFDSKLLNADDSPLFWDESLESGGGITASTPTAAKPYIDFTSTASTAGKFTRQTYQRFNYQPGKAQSIFMTGVLELSGGGTGVERRIGYFDDNNGAFFESDAGTIGVTTRSNDSGTPKDTTVAQSDWNLDKMDGSGPSQLTADFSKAQIFVIDFQWLSVGVVKFGLEINGLLRYIHEVRTANNAAIPWCSSPNLPVRYQMITTASSPVSTMRCICSAVMSEGGTDSVGAIHYTSTAGAAVTTNAEDSIFAVVGIRLKTARAHTFVDILKVGMQIQSASEYVEWLLIWNPTVAGTFTYSAVSNSNLERALGATANTVTNGTIIDGGYLESGTAPGGGKSLETAAQNALRLGLNIAGDTPDTLVLCVRPIGGVSAVDVEGSITWREIS